MASTQWPLAIMCALCAVSTLAMLMQYQRALQLKQLVGQMTARLRSGQKGYDDLLHELQDTKLERDGLTKEKAEMQLLLTEGQKRVASAERQTGHQQQVHDENIKRLSLETEHWREQSHTLTEQLKELVDEKRSAIAASTKELGEWRGRCKQLEQHSHKELNTLREQLAHLETEAKTLGARNVKLEDVLSKVNPEEIRRIKVKAHRMEQLFTSMKSLKDMAEERNQNWEIALRELSAYIVNKPETMRDRLTLPIGPLVGEALEKAGTALVHDEFTMVRVPLQQGATFIREVADTAHGV